MYAIQYYRVLAVLGAVQYIYTSKASGSEENILFDLF